MHKCNNWNNVFEYEIQNKRKGGAKAGLVTLISANIKNENTQIQVEEQKCSITKKKWITNEVQVHDIEDELQKKRKFGARADIRSEVEFSQALFL